MLSNEALAKKAISVRRSIVTSVFLASSGHPGGALSCCEILTYLFDHIVDAGNYEPHKYRFVLSKGHSCPALYGMFLCSGWVAHEEIVNFRKIGGSMQGHPSVVTTPWVETSTGSLGQGFSAAIGMALGHIYKNELTRIFVMLGDGELQEGEIWEGAMCAAHYKLDNLCAIVDYNKMQSDDLNENIMGLEPLRAKWEAFNWHVIEIDGHDFDQIESAFEQANETKGKPTVIIAHTIKGKGVSFMEGQPAWHGSVTLRPEELEQALRDLGTPEEDIPAYLNGSIWSRQA